MSRGLFDDQEAEHEAEHVFSVSELTSLIKHALEGTFPRVWVSGEISNLSRPRSGHLYFDLKDDQAVIKTVIWRSQAARLKFDLEDGQQVVCEGGLDVYAPHGGYKLIVRKIEPVGVGALQKAFEQLHRRLSQEGLFDPARKRPLPRFPLRVGFVTSPTGAAIHDFLQTIRRRWPATRVLVIPARVQGTGAAKEIAAGIQLANLLRPSLDLLVVGRGGGSMEDLWAFNEEMVVRAIYESDLPIVSAVGHEVDVTLSDLVADVRALTPTAAAEMVVPDQGEVQAALEQRMSRLRRGLERRLHLAQQRVDALAAHPFLRNPVDLIRRREQRLDDLARRCDRAMQRQYERSSDRLAKYAAHLEAISPLAVLKRGFSVIQERDSGRALTTVKDVRANQAIVCRLKDGQFAAVVQDAPSPAGHSSPDSASDSG